MLVLAISVLVTDGDERFVLEGVPCIHYPVQFQEDQGQGSQKQVRALLDIGSEVNTMSLAYAKRLGLKTRKTNVGDQKIDGSALETFGMVIADFQVENKSGRPRFFQKIFLVADIKFEVILEISFLEISNANMAFGEGILT